MAVCNPDPPLACGAPLRHIFQPMTDDPGSSNCGVVASLHLHPAEADDPLLSVDSFELVREKGIVGNGRYFDRTSRSTGKPNRRQVSLIAREQIAAHAASLGLESIPPGAVRANIETLGIDLMQLLGLHVAIGTAVIHFYEARTPCAKMDALCAGLRHLMENNRQGVIAEIITPGQIRVGDAIRADRPG
jgi:MOSC domain-containing protein YiiM